MSLLARCKARSDWLLLPLAALHINCHRVTSKIHLAMPRVKMSRADCNPWVAKMLFLVILIFIRNLDIFPLISPSDIVNINEPTDTEN